MEGNCDGSDMHHGPRHLGIWLHRTFGREREQGEKTLVMGLKDAVKLVLSRSPEAMALLQEHHTAGADAQMHRLLYIAFRALASK